MLMSNKGINASEAVPDLFTHVDCDGASDAAEELSLLLRFTQDSCSKHAVNRIAVHYD